jgi:putative transcriptional regulator
MRRFAYSGVADLSPSPEAERLIMGLHAIVVAGLAAVLPNDLVLRRWLAIVEPVRAGGAYLHDRRMTLTELANWIGMTLASLSILETGKARAIRFLTLAAMCEALSCQPGDLLRFEPEHAEQAHSAVASTPSASR